MLQDCLSVSDHFTTLRSKGLIRWLFCRMIGQKKYVGLIKGTCVFIISKPGILWAWFEHVYIPQIPPFYNQELFEQKVLLGFLANLVISYFQGKSALWKELNT